jgi:hypothetical protein
MTELSRLVLAKRIYLEAERYLSKGGDLELGLSVSLGQDSVELVLRSVTAHHSISVPNRSDFIGVFDLIAQHFKDNDSKKISFRSKVDDLNKARVSFKHYGLVPSRSDAVRMLSYAEDFLRDSLVKFFDLNFDDLSAADGLANLEVRDYLKLSEKKLLDNEYEDSLCAAAAAVQLSIGLMKYLLPVSMGRLRGLATRNISDNRDLSEMLNRVGRELDDRLQELREIAILASLPIDISTYRKFKKLTPNVSSMASGDINYQWMRAPPVDIDKIKLCVNFAADFCMCVDQKISEASLD